MACQFDIINFDTIKIPRLLHHCAKLPCEPISKRHKKMIGSRSAQRSPAPWRLQRACRQALRAPSTLRSSMPWAAQQSHHRPAPGWLPRSRCLAASAWSLTWLSAPCLCAPPCFCSNSHAGFSVACQSRHSKDTGGKAGRAILWCICSEGMRCAAAGRSNAHMRNSSRYARSSQQ